LFINLYISLQNDIEKHIDYDLIDKKLIETQLEKYYFEKLKEESNDDEEDNNNKENNILSLLFSSVLLGIKNIYKSLSYNKKVIVNSKLLTSQFKKILKNG